MYVGMSSFYPIGEMVWTVKAMNRGLLALAALAPGLLATPAGAAEIRTDRACYADPTIRKDTVSWTGSGFTPGGLFQPTLDGAALPGGGGTGNADAGGAAAGSFAAPSLERGTMQHTFTLGVFEGANEPTTTFTVSKLRATFSPASGNPRTLRVRFSLHGFGLSGAQKPPIYVHYVRPNGRVRSSVRLGTGVGQCGSLRSSRRRLFGFRAGRGRWTLQFDTAKKYVRPTPTSAFLFYRVPVSVR